ncbi:MAG TPA: class I SAM-dependent methyltransferase [Chloroflexota bacterium]|nr:class I SAM-dependent methyltransferase [Chloroflexota bacterium]
MREGLAGETAIADREGYLARMAQPLQAKLRIARFVPAGASDVLDVGCADGAVTCALAALFPETAFLGIDLDGGFVDRARERAAGKLDTPAVPNARFERVYLRELLARPERFDATVFCSVLHEFFTYGEGTSSVLKALADAHELLRPGGAILIRDMILHDYARESTLGAAALRARLVARCPAHVVADFERHFGPLDTLERINHLLLKYWYADNWARECAEHYVPVSFEQYADIFRLLGMSRQVAESGTLPFLARKWQTDLGLTAEQLTPLRSTGILVAQKGRAPASPRGAPLG